MKTRKLSLPIITSIAVAALAVVGAVPASAAPAVPGTPTASSITASSAVLSWNAVTGATGYYVLRGGTQIGSTTARTYTATGLSAGTTYSFTLKSYNASGASAASGARSVTTIPAAPGAPTAGTPTTNSVTLSWNAVTGATGYYVLRGGTQIGSTTARTYTATGLSAGTTYSFTLKAYNTTGASAASGARSVTTAAAVPAAPGTPTASSITASSAVLSWNAVTGATGYYVLRGGTQIGSTTARTYTATGLSAGTTYSFTLKSYNASGTSAAGGARSVTTVPAAPGIPTAGTPTSSSVALSWSAV
ncbi:MAG: fibronectin type III domain-containing protein, partial [Micrococcales bacterium]|nr:fibronectin type III domain-containing protein [Micrococcales bacterium]